MTPRQALSFGQMIQCQVGSLFVELRVPKHERVGNIGELSLFNPHNRLDPANLCNVWFALKILQPDMQGQRRQPS